MLFVKYTLNPVLARQGIVVDTSRLQKEPHVVAAARSKGLQVMTYGLGNNDAAWVQQQGRLGVAAVITDDVDSIAPLATARNILPSAFARSSISSRGLKAQAAPVIQALDLSAGRPLTAAMFGAAPVRAGVRQST